MVKVMNNSVLVWHTICLLSSSPPIIQQVHLCKIPCILVFVLFHLYEAEVEHCKWFCCQSNYSNQTVHVKQVRTLHFNLAVGHMTESLRLLSSSWTGITEPAWNVTHTYVQRHRHFFWFIAAGELKGRCVAVIQGHLNSVLCWSAGGQTP